MEVRRLRRDEADLLRDVRLRALRDAPWAFGSSLKRESAFAEEVWRQRADASEVGTESAMFVVIDGCRAVGLAGGVFDAHDRQTVGLIAVWIDPVVRRQGLARALVESVADWADRQGPAGSALRSPITGRRHPP